jgi:hypothetical protein
MATVGRDGRRTCPVGDGFGRFLRNFAGRRITAAHRTTRPGEYPGTDSCLYRMQLSWWQQRLLQMQRSGLLRQGLKQKRDGSLL